MYHHFLGEGSVDSELGGLLFSSDIQLSESLVSVICSKEDPLVCSHHDVVLFSFSGKILSSDTECQSQHSTPRVNIGRVKVKWNEDDLPMYESLLNSTLPYLFD